MIPVAMVKTLCLYVLGTCCYGENTCLHIDGTCCHGYDTCLHVDGTCCYGEDTCLHGDGTCCYVEDTCLHVICGVVVYLTSSRWSALIKLHSFGRNCQFVSRIEPCRIVPLLWRRNAIGCWFCLLSRYGSMTFVDGQRYTIQINAQCTMIRTRFLGYVYTKVRICCHGLLKTIAAYRSIIPFVTLTDFFVRFLSCHKSF